VVKLDRFYCSCILNDVIRNHEVFSCVMFPITSHFLFLFQIFSIWRVLIIVIQWRSKILFQLEGAVNVIKDMNYVSIKPSVTTMLSLTSKRHFSSQMF